MIKNTLNKSSGLLSRITLKVTEWIGTPQSLLLHTLFFTCIFLLKLIGFSINSILIILTTLVSLEAIYLAILIQNTVNRNTRSLEEVEEGIEEIQEDVEGLEDEVEDISQDLDEIQSDESEDEIRDREIDQSIAKIEDHLKTLVEEIKILKTKNSIPEQ